MRKSHAHALKLRRDDGYEAIEPLSRDGMRAPVGPEAFHGGMIDWEAGHIHPLRFAFGLERAASAAGVRIFELSEVQGVEGGTVKAAAGPVRANHVVLACNGYIGKLNSEISRRVIPINNFIVATEPLEDRPAEILAHDIAVVDSRFVVSYWRLSEGRRLPFGGGGNYGLLFPEDIEKLVRKPMLRIYPQLSDVRIDHAWGETPAITRNRMPDFARFGSGLRSASGYSGHGVAISTIAGKLMADAINGDAGGFNVMSTVRPSPLSVPAAMRAFLLTLATVWYSLRDRLGV